MSVADFERMEYHVFCNIGGSELIADIMILFDITGVKKMLTFGKPFEI